MSTRTDFEAETAGYYLDQPVPSEELGYFTETSVEVTERTLIREGLFRLSSVKWRLKTSRLHDVFLSTHLIIF